MTTLRALQLAQAALGDSARILDTEPSNAAFASEVRAARDEIHRLIEQTPQPTALGGRPAVQEARRENT